MAEPHQNRQLPAFAKQYHHRQWPASECIPVGLKPTTRWAGRQRHNPIALLAVLAFCSLDYCSRKSLPALQIGLLHSLCGFAVACTKSHGMWNVEGGAFSSTKEWLVKLILQPIRGKKQLCRRRQAATTRPEEFMFAATRRDGTHAGTLWCTPDRGCWSDRRILRWGHIVQICYCLFTGQGNNLFLIWWWSICKVAERERCPLDGFAKERVCDRPERVGIYIFSILNLNF